MRDFGSIQSPQNAFLLNLGFSVFELLGGLYTGSVAIVSDALHDFGDAIRFAASFEGIFMVLSGMGNMDMMRDNLSFMTDFKPLNDKELDAVFKVAEVIKSKNLIPCTSCRYCVDGCPMGLDIPHGRGQPEQRL